MPGYHKILTEKSIEILPYYTRKFIEKGVNYIIESSDFPDLYFDIGNNGYKKAKPYSYFKDKIQFHYLPNFDIQPLYKYWKVVKDKGDNPKRLERVFKCRNLFWEHFKEGCFYYLNNIIINFRKNNFEKFGYFLGSFLHIIQDGTLSLHSLEGIEGSDIFLLDRIIVPPKEDLNFLPTSILIDIEKKIVKKIKKINLSYHPFLLGTSIEEMIFILYSEFYKVQSSSRKKLIPIIFKIYEGKEKEAVKIYLDSICKSIKLCSDIIYSIISISYKFFKKSDLRKIEKIYLSDLKPIIEPFGTSLPYRFISYTKDYALNLNREKIPLKLIIKNEKRFEKKVFKKGFASGGHYEYCFKFDIPSNVYKNFSVILGLHADLGLEGEFIGIVKFRNKIYFKKKINRKNPSEKISFSVKEGGFLELDIKSNYGMGNTKNNIIWANPILKKL